MPYLKNSLVNLTIILLSLFFITISSSENVNFIFPKKKIITINTNVAKNIKVEPIKNFKLIDLPRKNPFRKKIELNTKIKSIEIYEKNKDTTEILPKKKSNLKK